MGRRETSGKPAKTPAQKILEALFLVPMMAFVLAAAGALMLAMLFAMFTLNLDGLAAGAGVMLRGIFAEGLLLALAGGVGAGVLATLLMVFVDRSRAAGTSAIAAFGVAGLVFFGYALWAILQSAIVASRWGGGIGAVLGALAGIATGIGMARSDREPRRLPAALRGGRRSAGPAPGETEWWRADLDTDADVD
jgi:hypothetical protein